MMSLFENRKGNMHIREKMNGTVSRGKKKEGVHEMAPLRTEGRRDHENIPSCFGFHHDAYKPSVIRMHP
jgi:hypothetical protein